MTIADRMTVLFNNVRFQASTAGVVDFGVGAASTGFLTPAQAAVPNTTAISYTAKSADLTQWEYGHGTYTGGVIVRSSVLGSSSANAKVDFAIPPLVWLDVLAEDIPNPADFATAAQGATADSAVQPGQLAPVAFSGAYGDLSGKPSLGTAASHDVGTAPGDVPLASDLAPVALSGAYGDLTGKPTLGTAAALNVGTGPSNVVQLDGSSRLPAVNGSLLTNIPGGLEVISVARDWYVSVAGNNSNDGSQASPWRTIAYGVAQLTTRYIFGGKAAALRLMDGTYDEGLNLSPFFGRTDAGGFIDIIGNQAHPENVILKPTSLPDGVAVSVFGSNANWRAIGLTVDLTDFGSASELCFANMGARFATFATTWKGTYVDYGFDAENGATIAINSISIDCLIDLIFYASYGSLISFYNSNFLSDPQPSYVFDAENASTIFAGGNIVGTVSADGYGSFLFANSTVLYSPSIDGFSNLVWAAGYPDADCQYVKTGGLTVSKLPSAPGAGFRATVKNADTPVIGSPVVGGGSAFAQVWFNGTAYTVTGI